jgi:hypothetical protein
VGDFSELTHLRSVLTALVAGLMLKGETGASIFLDQVQGNPIDNF